jgi:phosphatidylserine/phosphatidylglycerophosphate/cardiolipin synthase-like enzyme
VNRTAYPDRSLHTASSALVPADFLQSIFVAELLVPSRRFWISSPWISDVELIDNSGRQFSSLSPTWPADRIRLATILRTLLERGGRAAIFTNESRHNDEFVDRLTEMRTEFDGLSVARVATLHEKGIVADRFALDGSMNLTYNGVYVNEEYLIFRTDPAAVAERRLTLENRWREFL